uniref:MAM domain-containing protein n=1 Tax=Tetraodon nigroviridis TaxID=99883 RepID=H3CEL5_TETNG
TPKTEMCVRFWYWLPAGSPDSLTVYLLSNGELSEAIWQQSGVPSLSWEVAEVTVSSSAEFRVVFRYKSGHGHKGLVAVDDISFSRECIFDPKNGNLPDTLPTSGPGSTPSGVRLQSPRLPLSSPYCQILCSFEDGLCVWVQGAEDQLDWISGSGPTETPNTGPTVDHTTGKGKYLYIKSSLPSVRGHMAQLKSPLLPSAGDVGHCFTFWHHMFGATVGSLRMLLQTTDPRNKVWQKSGNQGDEWQLVQIHVTLQSVYQVILEATVGGEAGDIAIDDLSLSYGPCTASSGDIFSHSIEEKIWSLYASSTGAHNRYSTTIIPSPADLCDFEEGNCGWQQQTDDDFDWVRQSGPTHNPNTGPDSDHTTNAPSGHYYYLSSSNTDRAGQTARMSSPLYPSGKNSCVQLWYHMLCLNIYQQVAGETPALLFSKMGDQGQLWRFAQAGLLFHDRPYRVMVEGVKAGPTQVGDMAFDDVMLTDAPCPSPGHCDFEINMSRRSKQGKDDDEDWLRGRGNSSIQHR